MSPKQFSDFVKKNHEKSVSWLVQKTGRSESTVFNKLRLLRTQGEIPHKVDKPAEDKVKEDIAIISLKEKDKSRDAKYKQALESLQISEKALQASLAIKSGNTSHKVVSTSSGGSEATAFMVASDWHTEELVRKSQVSGVNEYTLEIARSRADNFFCSGAKLVKLFQANTEIKTIVLPLLGDFISGNLHEDSQERNQLGAMEAILYVQDLIHSGIKYLLANCSCNITIVCHSGNHGRISKKIHWGNENVNSLEYIMYCNLAAIFRDEKRVQFIIPDGDMSYLDVYNMKVRFIHGHQVKFGGGVGGITIPMRKAIAQWDRVCPSDLTIFGHFHQRIDGGNFIGNGSLIGYNAFAQAMKCEYEAPAQQFFLISNKNGGMKTVVAPIWLD